MANATIDSTDKKGEAVSETKANEVIEIVGSKYGSVIVAAKRARQINNYYHHIGEGTFDTFPPPMVDVDSKNYVTIAFQEIAEGKIKFEYKE